MKHNYTEVPQKTQTGIMKHNYTEIPPTLNPMQYTMVQVTSLTLSYNIKVYYV